MARRYLHLLPLFVNLANSHQRVTTNEKHPHQLEYAVSNFDVK